MFLPFWAFWMVYSTISSPKKKLKNTCAFYPNLNLMGVKLLCRLLTAKEGIKQVPLVNPPILVYLNKLKMAKILKHQWNKMMSQRSKKKILTQKMVEILKQQ